MGQRIGVAVTVAVFIGGLGTTAHAIDEPEAIIEYRKATMRAMGGHLAMLAAVAKNEVSFSDQSPSNAAAIHELSLHLARLFPEGTGAGETSVKTGALPAIWEKPDEFEAVIVATQESSQALVDAAGADDPAGFARAMAALGKNGCGACHEDFREKD